MDLLNAQAFQGRNRSFDYVHTDLCPASGIAGRVLQAGKLQAINSTPLQCIPRIAFRVKGYTFMCCCSVTSRNLHIPGSNLSCCRRSSHLLSRKALVWGDIKQSSTVHLNCSEVDFLNNLRTCMCFVSNCQSCACERLRPLPP